jgi:hypothetical protein
MTRSITSFSSATLLPYAAIAARGSVPELSMRTASCASSSAAVSARRDDGGRADELGVCGGLLRGGENGGGPRRDMEARDSLDEPGETLMNRIDDC